MASSGGILDRRSWTLAGLCALLAPFGAELRLPEGMSAGESEALPALSGACGDSRQARAGALFCAIKGGVADGNDFVDQALSKGVSAVLSDRPGLVCPVPVIGIRPGTGYAAVSRVAEAFADYPARAMRLVGITGTAGKTTTAFLLREILRAAGEPVGMIGTVVYDVGSGKELPADRTTPTPFLLQELFLQMRENGVRTVVMECSSAALHQERTGTARFAAAAFTNFSRDHLDYHGTMEEYWKAKTILFHQLLLPGAPAVLNLDDPAVDSLAQELSALPEERRPRVLGFRQDAEPQWRCPLPGAFNRQNARCAGLLARGLGVPEAVIRETLAQTHGAPGRLQRFVCPNGAVAFVDYAHTPEEIRCALLALRPECPGRLGILFGCGGDRDRGKRPMMAAAAAECADFLWITSDNPRTEDPEAILDEIAAGIPPTVPCHRQADRAQAIRDAVASCTPTDWLLIAGKGHEDYQEINHVKHPFSDWDVLRACARKM